MFWCFSTRIVITWQNTLFFLSEVSVSPQTSCSSAFRLKDMHDKILQPKKIFQRDRVSDVVLFGFLSVFGFTFIHLLTTAERKNYAVEGSRCINLSAGMPMNRDVLRRGWNFWRILGHCFKRGVFLFKRWIRISKRRWKDFWKLVARCRNSCSKFFGIL